MRHHDGSFQSIDPHQQRDFGVSNIMFLRQLERRTKQVYEIV